MTNTSMVFELSPTEKLQLVQDLWDSLASEPKNVPVRDSHLQEAARRREYLLQHPEAGVSWSEAQCRIRARHDD